MSKWGIVALAGCAVLSLLLVATLGLGFLAYTMVTPDAPVVQEEVVPTPPSDAPIVENDQPLGEPQPTLPVSPGDIQADALSAYDLENGLEELYQELEPGVVAIQVFVEQAGRLGGGSGSGFLIDEEGHVVTNEHVVAGATEVTVIFFDGFASHAEVLGVDADSDLAVLQVENVPDNARPLPLGDSDEVVPGEWVVAIGNPFGLQNTITFGIVSAVGRTIPARVGAFSIPQAIQTDAAINPGNSGGPLINLDGQVIGVNAQIQTGGGAPANAGVGFAIPVNTVRMVVPVLQRGEDYPWPWLGVSGAPVTLLLAEANDLDTQRGAYIASVEPGGPAAEAGLRGTTQQVEIDGIPVPVGGDVIIEADGERILDFADLLEAVAFSLPGDELDLTVLRDGRQIEITVELEERPGRQSF